MFKKWSKRQEPESSPAPVDQPKPRPPLVVDEPLRIGNDELSSGSHSYETLPFLEVVADWPDPLPDDRENRRAIQEHLLAVVDDQLGENVEKLRIEAFSGEAVHPVVAVGYLDDLIVVPIWIDGDGQRLTDLFDMGDAVQVDFRRSGSGATRSRWTPHDDMGEWMLGGRPGRWLGLLDAPKKAQFLEEQLAKNSSVSQANPTAAAEEWRLLLEVEGTTGADPLTDAELEDFVAATGLDMPAELEAVLRVANGAPQSLTEFMGSKDIIRVWNEWKGAFDSSTLEDLTSHYKSPTGEAVGMYCNPRWIPLVDERSGNFAAIDLAPGEAGQAGQIIYFGADESHSIRVIATDLADLIRRQREFITAEGYDDEINGFRYYSPG